MSAKVESIGIKRVEALHYYVRDLERSRRFYTEKLDFQEIAASSPELTAATAQQSVVFQAGACVIVCSQPIGEGGRAWRYLRKHPDGVGTIIFEVEDIDRAFRLLDRRGGTPIDEIHRATGEGGVFASFSITTPFGDTTFRFVERRGYRALFPGCVAYEAPRGGENRFGITRFDHITSNFQTMAPALLWMEHVLGLEPFWKIEFHTNDVGKDAGHGSGLRSAVMWDPGSGVKFANNEPYRPYFKSSQINVFNEEHRGDGVQHAALDVDDLLTAVRGMRARGVEFMPTPAAYYDLMPERLQRLGVGQIDEDVAALRELEVLVDGDGARSYLLQIFLKESSGTHRDPDAGPFFFELIQRKGDRGFGAGNFRALFESIERQQKTQGSG
ncbi:MULTISPECIES: 4-hydroxyphenylpyruvate dioxygenase family protein [Sorangium]|uniref:4-hydroxyphenylpyruvate dioxygenase n=1 Tax=Sorangium cellulosum TaxID=56 RepID=A0A4P2QPB6_SORCE|nr:MULTISPECIES: VOC family protein [Sorangium]AUX31989.1 4-hydroxyphenylpyruvate dioxygenase [Sorangium cellulosum]WCQ91362.1 4-hydroxyphenylpyruvate dioxygenase [Sorangium sp. Soce836]